MPKENSDRLLVLRLLLGGLTILMAWLIIGFYNRIQDLQVIFSFASQMYWLLLGLLLVSAILFVTFVLTWTWYRKWFLSLGSKIINLSPKSKPLTATILLLLIGLFSITVLFSFGDSFGQASIQWFLASWVVIIAMILFRRLMPKSNWLNVLSVAILSVGISYRLFQFLPDISAYPFSLGWSEASRYYYASLFFSEKIYGFWVPPSTLHPTRYLMQSIPFLIDGLPLWFHRFWQVILWLVCSFGTAVLLARRLKITRKTIWWLFLFWTFLFMWQGPIYYHLLVIVMIVLWGFDSERFWRSLIIVAIASAWAGISRVNWFPVPGMLATALYFLEQPKNEQPLWKYLLPPTIWTIVGFGIALGTQTLYIIWSGNDPELFASSFSSALLWYRLFPNATYSLGLLTGTLLISLPIFLLIWMRLRNQDIHLHSISLLGLTAILTVLLLGGLLVSTKIGGGSNLHNLDAYLALLLVIGSYFYFEKIDDIDRQARTLPPAWINFVIVFIPILITFGSSSQFLRFHPQATEDSLLKMQRNISRALEDGGEILFISERQLLTFDYIDGVTLVPEYEKVFLMEMVMAGNRNYLDAFETDIQNQRFDLIITDPLFDMYKEPGGDWAEENNVWVNAVSVPILCNYWRKVTFAESGVQILAPRDNSEACQPLKNIEILQ